MEVYDDGSFCFSCGWVDKSVRDTEYIKTSPEDVSDTLEYIKSLPKKLIRGLELPYDNSGYYIVWPDNSFYKKRVWEGNSRYLGPRGLRPPLYLHEVQDSKTLVIIEGELNCESLYQSIPKSILSIASPGSATEIVRHIDFYCTFPIVSAILDKDPAGVAAGVALKREMLKRNKRIDLVCIEKDYNDILQEEGTEGVKQAFIKDMGLRSRV